MFIEPRAHVSGCSSCCGVLVTIVYIGKTEQLEIALREKTQNLRRLEAQRNELNTKGTVGSRHRGIFLFQRVVVVDE